MTKFEKECYEALKRLKKAAKEGSKKLITREAVCREVGKPEGSIRPVRHPDLCKDILQAEADRKAGILGLKKDEQTASREVIVEQEESIDKLKKGNQQLQMRIEKQAGVMLNLLNELDASEQELEIYKDRLEKADNRINTLIETIKPRSV